MSVDIGDSVFIIHGAFPNLLDYERRYSTERKRKKRIEKKENRR